MMMASTVGRWLWPLAGLVLALLLALTPPFAMLDRAWRDAVLRLTAEPLEVTATLVVDIDAPSMRSLLPTAGAWPYARDLHAAAAQRLLALGAEAVVFNLLFADARDGDAALRQLAGQSGRVIFAADARRDALVPQGADPVPLRGAAWPVAAGVPAASWAALVLPAPGLLPAAPRLGVMQVPLDDDGRLRCATLFHRVDGLVLPSLALAAFSRGATPPAVLRSGDGVQVGARHWPLDDRGCVALRLPRAADAMPVLSFASLTPGVAGGAGDADLARRIRGRTVFVGSPSVLDAKALTPLGQIGGTLWQALAHEALHAGWVLRPHSALADGALLLLALAPSALAGRKREPSLRHTAATTAAALAAGALLAWALLSFWALPSALPLAVLMLAGGLLGATLQQQHWLELQRREAQIERAAADAANRAKSEFLAHMSHEIRTPLNAVLGIAQLLAETPLSPLQRRYVETFGRAGTHLRQLVDDVLDLSRLEADGLPIESLPFDLRALADELRALFESRARAQNLALAIDVDPAVPQFVLGDRHRLRQILVNLLGNALKFTSSGSVALQARRQPGNARIEFCVRDTGIGVPAEKLRTIFEPFTQADAGVARRFGGSGLGLAITRRLALAMGGEVSITSREGQGTEVRVQLPLPASSAPPQPAFVQEPAVPATLAGRRLLLVEDNEHNILVVQGMLDGTGASIDIARDGRSGAEMAASAAYDLILMDLHMPVLDGFAATREIRAEERRSGRPPVPVIALSANALATDAQASRDAGCDAHLGKPVEKAHLLRVIGANLRAAQAPAAGTGIASAPVIDPASALARMGGDAVLFAKAQAAASRQWQAFTAAFEHASARGDAGERRRLAHDLKSTAAALGATRLWACAAELEALLVAGEDSAAALAEVQAALIQVLNPPGAG